MPIADDYSESVMNQRFDRPSVGVPSYQEQRTERRPTLLPASKLLTNTGARNQEPTMRFFSSSLGRVLQAFGIAPCSGPDVPPSTHRTIDPEAAPAERSEPGDLSVLGLCVEMHPEECRGEMAGLLTGPDGGDVTSVVDTSRHSLI